MADNYVFVLFCCLLVQGVAFVDPTMDLNVTNKIFVSCSAGNFLGKIDVVLNKEVKMFLGIPYANSPTGDLRFKKSTKLRTFEDLYDATKKGAPCLNRDVLFTGNRMSHGREMSEDCLFLNIYAPVNTKNHEALPVIIFIHERDLYMTEISEITNGFKGVVFVHVQYRMNLWGFLSTINLQDITKNVEPGHIGGNTGLWDQHFAIKWVHENIQAFGGDPGLVTLFGYFEGASNVLYQAMFEENEGLFKRIIVNCGAVRCPWAINTLPSQTTRMIGRALDCRNDSIGDVMSCISLKTTDEIIDSVQYHRICIQFSYETPVSVDGIFIKRLLHETLDPFKDLEIKERLLLSKYEILTAVNQDGGRWKPASWMSVRVSDANLKSVFPITRLALDWDDLKSSENNATDTNITTPDEEMYKFVNRYVIDSLFSDTFVEDLSNQNISELIDIAFPNMCGFNQSRDVANDQVFVSDQIVELARVMLGLHFNEKSMKRLERNIFQCSTHVFRTVFACIISSYPLGGRLWTSKPYCPVPENGTILVPGQELNPYNTPDGSDPYKVIAPPVNNFESVLMFDTMSDRMCRTLPSGDDVNQSDATVRNVVGTIWTSFAETGALSSVVALGANIICNKIPGLAPRQRAICRSRPVAIAVIGGGARLGLNECQYQFRNMRWNCTMASKYDSMFGYQHDIASREAAVWSAMASSGVVYAITQACSLGTLNECGCDKSKMNFRRSSKHNHDFMWGGCSADVKYGLKLARKFLDAREIEQTARSLMNKHNNKVGRKAVRDNMKLECRCHGPTGSCSIKTCWRRLPSFRDVGDYLLKQYHKSKQVVPWRGSRLLRPNALVLKKSNRPNKKPRRRDLVFLELSPNFCEHNLTTGSLGTVGRKCDKGSRGNDGCTLMCCGRGYNTHQYTRTWQCNCTFRWCCEVNCKNCTEKRLEYTCK